MQGTYVFLSIFSFLIINKGLNDENCQNTESYQNAALRSLLDSLPKVCYLAGSKVFFKREPLAGLLSFCLHSKEVFEYFVYIVFISVIFLQSAYLV